MRVESLRQEFQIYVVDMDSITREACTASLKSVGYRVHSFPTVDSLLVATKENLPHMIVASLSTLADKTESTLKQIQDLSPEILVFLLAERAQAMVCVNQIQSGLAYDHLSLPAVSSLELIQKLDRTAERLYYQYENEQMREGHGLVQSTPTLASSHTLPSWGDVSAWLTQLSAVREVDTTVQAFMDGVSAQFANAPIVYFKYLPHYLSLIVSASTWLPIDKIRGIGIDLKAEDPNRLPELFREPKTIEPLRQLLSQVFKLDRYSAFAHYQESEILGMFVVFNVEMTRDEVERLQLMKSAFDLVYRRNLLLKEKHALEIHDPLTGALNRRHFRQKLEEEITRARRIQMPVSMICFDIDEFHRLNHSIGFAQADALLKTVASVLRKTVRGTDLLARTGPDEMVLLLPHTDHAGAAVKAERIRRMVETTKFPALQGRDPERLTVSVGVSEYPSFCGDADALLRTTDEALQQVKTGGGNKVCLATVPAGYQPDFILRERAPSVAAGESV